MTPLNVFLLAAGRGERLRPLTDKTPKPLLEVSGKPILLWLFEELRTLRIEKLVVNAWHLKDQIIEFCRAQQDQFPFKIEISCEEQLLGTAGGLKKALEKMNLNLPLLSLNGDCLWAGDIAAFVERAQLQNATEASWALFEPRDSETQIHLCESRVCQVGDLWRDKKKLSDAAAVFSGIQLYKRIDQALLPEKGCIIRDYWIHRLCQGAQIYGDRHFLQAWEDYGTPERYRAAHYPFVL